MKSNEQKLLFTLVYQKAYPLQELIGAVFECSQAQVNYWIHRLLPVLRDALDDLGFIPEREPSQFARHERGKGETPELIIDEKMSHSTVPMRIAVGRGGYFTGRFSKTRHPGHVLI